MKAFSGFDTGVKRAYNLDVRSLTAISIALAAAVITAACGGSSSTPEDPEAQLRRDVERYFDALFDGDFSAFQSSLVEECRGDLSAGEFALGRASIGALIGEGVDLGASVTEVEFLADDRALVAGQVFIDGAPLGDDAERTLWVLQGGRWRSADDCDAFEVELSQAIAQVDAALNAERAEIPGLTRENPIPLGESRLLQNDWEISILGSRFGWDDGGW